MKVKVEDLKKVDLVKTSCPYGVEIEIEGLGALVMQTPCINGLLSGIATAYAILSNTVVFENEEFLQKITLLELNLTKKFVKVRVAT